MRVTDDSDIAAMRDMAMRQVHRVLHSRWTLVLVALGIGGYLVSIMAKALQEQWDFSTYFHAARVWSMGGNPYQLAELSASRGTVVVHPYVYPPPTLWAFSLFSWLEERPAALLYFALKLVAFVLLVTLWLRVFIRDTPGRILLLVLCGHAFRRTFKVDLLAGNISTFEQLLVWSGVAFLLWRKGRAFGLLVGASALFKVVTVALLPLAWVLRRTREALGHMALGVGLLVVLNAAALVLQPGLFTSFRQNVGALDERGATNPASLAFIRDALAKLGEGVSTPGLEWGLYALFVLLVVAASARAAWRLSPERDAMLLVSLYFLTYALILPRFKDYSYIALLVPATVILREGFRTRPVLALLVTLLVCTQHHPYQPLFAALCLFGMACAQSAARGLRGGAEHPTSSNSSALPAT